MAVRFATYVCSKLIKNALKRSAHSTKIQAQLKLGPCGSQFTLYKY